LKKALELIVLAGTLNQSRALEIRVERVGQHTALRHIIDTLERGSLARAPIENLADRLGNVLVYWWLERLPSRPSLSRAILDRPSLSSL